MEREIKFIRTNGVMIWGKFELTKEYLAGVRDTGDMLIDVNNQTYFDSDENKWVEIPHD